MKNKNINVDWLLVIKIFLTMAFLPFVAIWYIWEKTNWSKRNKWIAIAAILFFIFIAIASDSNNSNQQTQNLENKVAQLETQLREEHQKNYSSDLQNKDIQEINDTKLYDVVNVTDGDTIKVNVDGKIEAVRFIGIDTPETVDPRKPVQCFGKEASGKAKETLTNKKVKLENDNTQGDRDQYGRLLRYVHLEDGTFFNKKMIEDGYAHEYTFQSNPYKYQKEFQAAENSARENKKGLWGDACNGNTEKAATSASASPFDTSLNNPQSSSSTEVTSESAQDSSGGVVKKSSTGICHAPGTTYYAKTKNYISFDSIQACLDSGGRLPKR